MPETTPRPAAAAKLWKLRPSPNDLARVIRGLCVSAHSGADGGEPEAPSPRVASRFAGWEVPVTDQAPALVRRWASALLSRWEMADAAQDAVTVLTELVTNARQAGATRMIVLVEPDAGPDLVGVGVWDDAPGVPCRREPDWCAERGRGLLMVEALTAAWGHHPLPPEPAGPGKVVWAAIAGSGDGA